ncbi:hypothetical protein [Tissierella praeacuta]|uniref:hypothetical protein n=1 Tax=Tissierella praeacuta TaxID=43131 RepID=UPI002FDB24BF
MVLVRERIRKIIMKVEMVKLRHLTVRQKISLNLKEVKDIRILKEIHGRKINSIKIIGI